MITTSLGLACGTISLVSRLAFFMCRCSTSGFRPTPRPAQLNCCWSTHFSVTNRPHASIPTLIYLVCGHAFERQSCEIAELCPTMLCLVSEGVFYRTFPPASGSGCPPTPCQFTYLSCNVSWLAAQLFPRLPEQARSTPILPISTIAALVAHTSMLRHTAGPSLTRTLQAPSPASISTKPRPGSPGTFNHNLDVCAHQALNIDTNTPTPSLVWMRSF